MIVHNRIMAAYLGKNQDSDDILDLVELEPDLHYTGFIGKALSFKTEYDSGSCKSHCSNDYVKCPHHCNLFTH